MSEETITYNYSCEFASATKHLFTLQLEAKTLDLAPKKCDEPPVWTALEKQHCSNFPLKVEEPLHCPIAEPPTAPSPCI
ncbi:MAG TPA: hypothetical protein EYQ18_23565 [Candidatus Handelsmanbacteria bacterium]|nr:hypothetical protein [Candidatus Handelsmanbacteria bacterium]